MKKLFLALLVVSFLCVGATEIYIYPNSADVKIHPGGLLSLNSKISPLDFGAVGDGVVDDSSEIQEALTLASLYGWDCEFPAGYTFFFDSPLFVWGSANLVGTGTLKAGINSGDYAINFGISSQAVDGSNIESPFSGKISNLSFEIVATTLRARFLQFWNSEDAILSNLYFDFSDSDYSATQSVNDAAWVVGSVVRKNITVSDSTVFAAADDRGSEGFGFSHFDGVLIESSTVTMVGDDPIGIHSCNDVTIRNSDITSIDGRIYFSNSTNVIISGNSVARVADAGDDFNSASALIYGGHESGSTQPANVTISDNTLTLPLGALDNGATIYMNGIDGLTIDSNVIDNDSTNSVSGIIVVPVVSPDFDMIDVLVQNNESCGDQPAPIKMQGSCSDYSGTLEFLNNTAESYALDCSATDTNNQICVGIATCSGCLTFDGVEALSFDGVSGLTF